MQIEKGPDYQILTLTDDSERFSIKQGSETHLVESIHVTQDNRLYLNMVTQLIIGPFRNIHELRRSIPKAVKRAVHQAQAELKRK